MYKKLLLLFLTGLVGFNGICQVQNRFAGWLSIVNSIQLNKKFGLQADISLRSSDQWEHIQTLILRPGISYRINQKITALIGYSNNLNRINIADVSEYLTEHQLWQQVVIRFKSFNRLNTTHRPLIEERFIYNTIVENNSIKTNGRSFALRFRYLFRNMLPFYKQTIFTHGPYAYAQQELLINLGNKEPVNGKIYDQFRALTGLGYRFSSKWDMEAGYLFRDIATRTGAHFHDNIIQIGSILRL